MFLKIRSSIVDNLPVKLDFSLIGANVTLFPIFDGLFSFSETVKMSAFRSTGIV
jgi:hypothetical protein